MKMMNKILVYMLLAVVFHTYKSQAIINSIEKSILLNTSPIEHFLQDDRTTQQYFPKVNLSSIISNYRKTGKSGINTKDMLVGVEQIIIGEFKNSSKLLLELMAVVILCALLQNLGSVYASGNEGISDIANYACMLILSLLVIKSFLPVLSLASETVNKMNSLMNVLLPPLVSMVALSGGIVTAAVLDPVVLAAIKITSDMIVKLILPMTGLATALSLVDSLSTSIKVTKLAALMRQLILTALGFIMTIFVGVVSIRSSMASTMDEVALKTTKLAVDTFVPVVGKSFSDAVAAVAGYSNLLREAISLVGLLVMALICLMPLIKIAMIALVYKFVGALIEPMADRRIADCLTSVGNTISILFACVASTSVLFFIMISIISSSGKLIVAVR